MRRIGGIAVTPYTVNQGVDQWHVLYAWRRRGTLYTISEHVIKPLTYRQVVRNLDKAVAGLVLGSVALRSVVHADCPVMVVHPTEPARAAAAPDRATASAT